MGLTVPSREAGPAPTSSSTSFALSAATVLVAATLLTACSDTARPVVEPAALVVDSSVTSRQPGGAPAFAWVGASHNLGLDLVRSAYRDSRLAGRQACREFLELDFSSIAPPEFRNARDLALMRQFILGAMAGSPCQPAAKPSVRHASASSNLSAEAQSLLDQVDAAIANASTPGDLSARLGPIYSAAGSLASPEYEIVSASTSVAEASVDYWYNGWNGFVSDIGAQYEPCLRDADYWEQCLGTLDVSFSSRRFGFLPLYSLATVGRLATCSYTSHPFRTLGSADFRSAIGGAIGGALSGGPGGALVGAVGGGMAGSVAAGIPLGLAQFFCDLAR